MTKPLEAGSLSYVQRTIVSVLFLTGLTVFYGCGTSSDARVSQPLGAPVIDQPPATIVDARPAALVDGRSVSWGELRPMLSEAAGAEMLRELILTRRIDEAATEAGITVPPDAVAAERSLLLRTLSDDPNVAVRLLNELRARQGLGPVRFAGLMQRNATLRAMVQDRVQVSDDAARRMFESLHGPKRQARLMVLPTLGVARSALKQLEDGAIFGEVAAELSTDSSAARGGLLEPISRVDESYPRALRKALFELHADEVSPPILLDDQYALLMLVREYDADDVAYDDVRDDMFRRVRLQQERMLMDQIARELVRDVTVNIFDESLNDSWERSRRGGARSEP